MKRSSDAQHGVTRTRPGCRLAAVATAVALTLSCAGRGLIGGGGVPAADLSDGALASIVSAGPFEVEELRVITDNDAAFAAKLRLVEGARTSLDLIYYIYGDDYSSSVLSAALIDAAHRGVRVRLLVDYHTNYAHLDLFSMLEQAAGGGEGSLEVRFYNRPTAKIVADAVFMTLGCGEGAESFDAQRCDRSKYDRIEAAFANETIDGRSAGDRNISNLDLAGSGLFLSGLYAKRPDVMALAVTSGHGVSEGDLAGRSTEVLAEDREDLARLARIYYQSRVGSPLRRLEARLKLALAFRFFGERIDPIYNAFVSFLPVEKPGGRESRDDWQHLTDFTHHKLMLADSEWMQLGGRNVEDAYHMHPGPLTSKYVFMDTDCLLHAKQGGEAVARTFEELWGFRDMVATLEEVRSHAPNELVANIDGYKAAREDCDRDLPPSKREACVDREFRARYRDLDSRIQLRRREMEEMARTYREEYRPTAEPNAAFPTFTADTDALVAYLENLPFDRRLPLDRRRRLYGARNGHELEDGKQIHHLWLASLAAACDTATPENPRRVILHNAYFFPPSNLLHALSQMVDGDWQCRDVTIDVLTNSIDTTDLSPVNLAWRHAMKAFSEYYEEASDPDRRATFRYHEYRRRDSGPNLSLHSKVTVLGDDLVVGSANADVRSYMMDTNNGVLIRHVPRLVADYLHYVDGLLADADRVVELTDHFAATSRATLIEEDKVTFRALLKRWGIADRLDADEIDRLESRFLQVLDEAYALARGSIRKGEGRSGRKQQRLYNETFQGL